MRMSRFDRAIALAPFVIIVLLFGGGGLVLKLNADRQAKEARHAAMVREVSDYIDRAQRQRNEALRVENALLRKHGDPDEIQALRLRRSELTAQIDEAEITGCERVDPIFCAWRALH